MNKNITYYFLLLPQIDLFQNQILEEILRERANFYVSKNKVQDFWILPYPKFLQNNKLFIKKIYNTNFYKNKKDKLHVLNNQYPFLSAIISLNEEFLIWIALRCGHFENLNQQKKSFKINYLNNGLSGKLIISKKFNYILNPLESFEFYLHPDILINKYKIIINKNILDVI